MSDKQIFAHELGPELPTRKAIDTAKKNTHTSQESENLWAVAEGAYIFPFTPDQGYVFQAQEDLVGTEVVFSDLVQKKLDERKRTALDRPLIFVDFGGMLGSTWCKLAYKYRDEVTNDEAIFVVTNLNLSKEQIKTAVPQLRKTESRDPVILDTVEKGIDFVEYVNADAAKLWESSIKIGAHSIPFKGNIDLLHESMALMHGSVPDQDLSLLGGTMSDRGVMFVGSNRADSGVVPERIAVLPEIDKSFEIGLQTLSSKLSKLDGLTNNYAIFASNPSARSLFEKSYPKTASIQS